MTPTMVTVVLALVAGAQGQVGTLDQVSPASNGVYHFGALMATWQQQVRPALPGILEGVRLTLVGEAGWAGLVRIRAGPAPGTEPPLFEGPATKTTSSTEIVFVETADAEIHLIPGVPLVIELQGLGTELRMMGSHVPPPGVPLYPEPLYFRGLPFVAGHRIAFETYVITPPGCYPDCDADGVLGLSDFGCFQTKFGLGDPYADCNGDQQLNLADFGCFQTKFALGCP